MKQARVPTDAELKRVLAVVAQSKHGVRNRMALMLSYLAGLRVGEIAALTVGDLFESNGSVREQLRLSAAITKGGHARVVFLSERLRKEIERYRHDCLGVELLAPSLPLLITQKRTAFSANTLCQLIGQLYRQAGLDGATSHSGRRWFITRLSSRGTSVSVIMRLAGHKNLATTQRYVEVSEAQMRTAVDLL